MHSHCLGQHWPCILWPFKICRRFLKILKIIIHFFAELWKEPYLFRQVELPGSRYVIPFVHLQLFQACLLFYSHFTTTLGEASLPFSNSSWVGVNSWVSTCSWFSISSNIPLSNMCYAITLTIFAFLVTLRISNWRFCPTANATFFFLPNLTKDGIFRNSLHNRYVVHRYLRMFPYS